MGMARSQLLRQLISAGLIDPPVALEKTYRGVLFKGTIEADGRISFAGETYDSLSTAAAIASKSVIGSPPGRPYPPTNGWRFWRYRDTATGELRPVTALRQSCLEAKD